MAPKNRGESSTKKSTKKGAWTADEDTKLAQYVEVHGAKRWKTVAMKAGLNRCGKSCRLRWLNYLRPNIKRGNISDEEEDLIVRLHKLLGNRWSLIAGRLPGRTDNEIKNYWNSHLSKKLVNKQEETAEPVTLQEEAVSQKSYDTAQIMEEGTDEGLATLEINLDDDDLFDFPTQGFDWVNKFLELGDDDAWFSDER